MSSAEAARQVALLSCLMFHAVAGSEISGLKTGDHFDASSSLGDAHRIAIPGASSELLGEGRRVAREMPAEGVMNAGSLSL